MNKDLLVKINLDQVKTLSEIALKARDKFEDRGYWIRNFNRAIDGIRARIFGLKNHYNSLQSIRNEPFFNKSMNLVIQDIEEFLQQSS